MTAAACEPALGLDPRDPDQLTDISATLVLAGDRDVIVDVAGGARVTLPLAQVCITTQGGKRLGITLPLWLARARGIVP
jgi:hypothetical protein